MTIKLRPKRILLISFLFLSSIELLYTIPTPSWYFSYERATWDGRKWTYYGTPNDAEIVINHYYEVIRKFFKH